MTLTAWVRGRYFSTSLLRYEGKNKPSSAYSQTVILPKTSFPSRIEGQKRIEADLRILQSPNVQDLYQWQREARADKPEFVLHDGPPYANGSLHLGHAVNKILKDVTNRWKLVKGYRVHYRPGWDCHGLPIELKVKKSSDAETPLSIRKKARQYALSCLEDQKQGFQSWGVIGDFQNAYLTISPGYMKEELRMFLKLYQKGHIFQRYMPVYWSPASKTALAESELEYDPNYNSTAVYVRFPLTDDSVQKLHLTGSVYALIWTTTPWSLTANKAICYKPDSDYSILRLGHNESYIVATELLEKSEDLKDIFTNVQPTTERTIKGSDLYKLTYAHPIQKVLGLEGEMFKFLPGNHVTLSAGTGLVHTAPAHGQDDYLIGVENALDLECQVDENGCYDASLPNCLSSLPVLTDGSAKVIELLDAHVLKSHMYQHSYPCDWRSKTPTILRASKQWFINISSLQSAAMDKLKNVQIIPKSSQFGFKGVVEKRPYWCISRQRAWGCPIPMLYDKDLNPVINDVLVQKYCDLIDSQGCDFWWELNVEDLLHGTGIDPDSVTKGTDILDIWFDSGISWHTLPKKSNLYLEGLDQFSGWFYSSLMTKLALSDDAPYDKIFVHGFTLDEEGGKMSKSLGNVIEPAAITRGTKSFKPYGVDVLRFWVAAHASQHSQILVGKSIFDRTKQDVDRIRLIFRFLLGNISTLKNQDQVLQEGFKPLDRFVLHQLSEFCLQISDHYEEMSYNKVCLTILNFIANELSSFYFQRVKDRLYCDLEDSLERKSAVSCLFHLLHGLLEAVGPVMPILVSEVCESNPMVKNCFKESLKCDRFLDEVVVQDVEVLKDLQTNILQIFADENNLKNSEFSIANLNLVLNWTEKDLSEFLQVSKVCRTDSNDKMRLSFEIRDSKLYMCARCRLRLSQIENELCSRCADVIEAMNK